MSSRTVLRRFVTREAVTNPRGDGRARYDPGKVKVFPKGTLWTMEERYETERLTTKTGEKDVEFLKHRMVKITRMPGHRADGHAYLPDEVKDALLSVSDERKMTLGEALDGCAPIYIVKHLVRTGRLTVEEVAEIAVMPEPEEEGCCAGCDCGTGCAPGCPTGKPCSGHGKEA